jgi:UDPglucose 6-dehydrogenase
MKITIIGTGYVGLVTAACLAELGNEVFCLDVDSHKIDALNSGQIPIHEPGLDAIISRNRLARRISFSTDIRASVDHGDLQFIAVGTPSDEDGSADLQYVLAAARNIGRHMSGFKVIVNKSTVPVGTGQKVRDVIEQELTLHKIDNPANTFSVISNPEFLKEGAAVEDFMRPDRIVIGVEADSANSLRAGDMMRRLYAPFNRNHERTLYMDIRSAEFTKYAANAMLATRISFMNEMANLSDRVGADIEAVRRGIGADPRIGYHFLYAGCGYGGSCFPKDVRALISTGLEAGEDLKILDAVESVNNRQKDVLIRKITRAYGDDLTSMTFAVWGLAFKPNTDDLREAPSRRLIADLLSRGARVRAYDPVAMEAARAVLADDLARQRGAFSRLTFAASPVETVENADALIVVTEWKEFRSPDFGELRRAMKMPVIFDGRNLYEPQQMREWGFAYHAIGRSSGLHETPAVSAH